MAVLLFNMDSVPQQVEVALTALGFEGSSVHVRDVWAKAALPDTGPTVTAKLGPHDSALLMLSPADSQDKSGPHPYHKIGAEWAAKINATQYAAWARASCSYRKWD
jgi:hypothetical protein